MEAMRPGRLASLLLLVTSAATACGGDDKAEVCRAAGTDMAAEAVDRKIIGQAAPYQADPGLASRDDELTMSIAARRAAAWQIAQKVLTPVPLAEPALAPQFGGQPVIPAWHTWYGKDDFTRLFKRLYDQLGPAGRTTRTRFDGAAIEAALAWNPTALDELPTWPEQRYLDYLAAIDEDVEANGVGGITRVGYSPGALRHLLRGYDKTYACRLADPPPAYALDPVREGKDVVAREALAVDGCELRQLGPFLAADGAALEVVLAGQGDADLYVRRGAPPTLDDHDCRSQGGGADERCTVAGGGPIYVGVLGFGDGATVTAETRYREADVRDPACLDGEFPGDAVIIKAEWRRTDFGDPLPKYDTSGARMATRLRPDGQAEWGPGDGFADPTPDQIYTVKVSSGATYRLAGLHIMTKELTHWVWITLWWSDTPDQDFGADRPAAIAGLGGPWTNYKMCVATSFLEGDADGRGGFAGSLGDALGAVHHGVGAPTWCSNPYLEQGAGNGDTNCIGCHQHGGTPLTAEDIISDEGLFPHHGSTRIRNNFFTDYSWAVQGGRGDDLGSIVQNEVEFWDTVDP